MVSVADRSLPNRNSPITTGAPAPTSFLPLDNSNAPAASVNLVTTPASSTSPMVTGIADGVPYTIGAGGVVFVDGNVFNTAYPTTSTMSDGHVVVVGPTGDVSIQELPSQQSPGLSPRDYVVGSFIPTILAVLLLQCRHCIPHPIGPRLGASTNIPSFPHGIGILAHSTPIMLILAIEHHVY